MKIKKRLIREFASFIGDVVTTERDPTDATGARQRLMERTAPSGLSEQVPADGGFIVPPEFANLILMRAYQESAVMARCVPWTLTSNVMRIPAIDETSRADGSRWGGVRGYWMNEADALTGSKARFRTIELTTKKVGILSYLTSELMSDMGVLADYLIGSRGVLGKELAWKVTDAAINGDGAGKPQGVINSPAVISVSRTSGNAIGATDVLNMLARFWVGSRTDPQGFNRDDRMDVGPKPAWYCHSDVIAQLATCVIAVGSGGSLAFLYNPETANLMGYPVIPIEQCQPLGTQGDLVLADMNEYLLATRDSNLNVSMHVRFLNDEQTIRLILRVDGQGAWNSAVTPFNGTNTQSPFVVLHA